jgi:purine-binding chemotaxis protein CheW
MGGILMLDDAHAPTKFAPEFVVVGIGEQRFAIAVQLVREIRGWSSFTPLPHAPEFVLGMINLRGLILPVVDLGARLGKGPTQIGPSAVVIVAEVANGQVGLLVDEVCDIVTVQADDIQKVPDYDSGGQKRFVNGMLTTEEGILTLLDPTDILTADMAAAA